MSRYAQSTSVSAAKSRAEIEDTLARYGADSFGYMTSGAQASVAFQMKGRSVRLDITLPDPESSDFTKTPGGKRDRDRDGARKAWEQACRQRWRALALVVKAKLEGIEAGITTFDDEFLASIVLAGGQRVGPMLKKQLDKHGGRMPLLLGPGVR